MLRANPACTSRNESPSTTPSMTLMHVIGLARRIRDDGIKVVPADRRRRPFAKSATGSTLFCGRYPSSRRVEQQRIRLRRSDELRDTAHLVVNPRTTQSFEVHLFVGHRLHDVGTGDEHVARPIDHDREVSDGRRVHRATGTGSENHGQLRDDTGHLRIAEEDVGISAERRHALLDAGAAGVGQTDDRCAACHREIHHFADLLGMGLRQRSSEHGEVLGIDEDRPAIDRPHPVTTPSPRYCSSSSPNSVVRWMTNASSSWKRVLVEQDHQPLPSSQLATGMLLSNALLAAAEQRRRSQFLEVLELVCCRHRSSRTGCGPSRDRTCDQPVMSRML